ncbi:hypothetical protein ZWY2020_026970 [Hordeum vulgare]|nr:hypothetical protein ZWY2020_026970 [Hordeum vulgare]
MASRPKALSPGSSRLVLAKHYDVYIRTCCSSRLTTPSMPTWSPAFQAECLLAAALGKLGVDEMHGGGVQLRRDGGLQDGRGRAGPRPLARRAYPIRDWKHGFFFLASATPWPCPVDWGEPSRSSFLRPVLSGEETKWAAKLLRAHAAAPVEVSTLLSRQQTAAATMVSSPVWPPPSCIRTSSTTGASSKVTGMDPSVYDMMKTMLADKKRSLDKANGVAGPESSVLRKNPPAAADVCSVPPTGDLGSPQHFTSRLVDDSTERVIAASRPSYTLELEEKLRERRTEITALRKQLEEYNNTVKDTGDKERGGLRDEHQAANKAANRRDAFFLLLVVFLG